MAGRRRRAPPLFPPSPSRPTVVHAAYACGLPAQVGPGLIHPSQAFSAEAKPKNWGSVREPPPTQQDAWMGKAGAPVVGIVGKGVHVWWRVCVRGGAPLDQVASGDDAL